MRSTENSLLPSIIPVYEARVGVRRQYKPYLHLCTSWIRLRCNRWMRRRLHGRQLRPSIEIEGYTLQRPPCGGLLKRLSHPIRDFMPYSQYPCGTLQNVALDFNRRVSPGDLRLHRSKAVLTSTQPPGPRTGYSSSTLLKTTHELCPPNPIEFDIATSTFAGRAVCGT